MAVFERLNIVSRQPPKNASVGLFGPYDANIVGGALIGIGMGSTGACPGTVLVQVATGVKSGIFVALGGLLGGVLYARFGQNLKKSSTSIDPSGAEKQHTIQAKFDLDANHVLLAYEVMCLCVIGVAAVFGLDGDSASLHPILGGFLIGGAQAASLLLRGTPVGVSKAYEEAGQHLLHLFPSQRPQGPRSPALALTFASGILGGSWLLAQYLPTSATLGSLQISSLRALAGGCAMVFGARLAGGCTSGHGISGMSSFSVASVITVVSMFGGGIATAMMMV